VRAASGSPSLAIGSPGTTARSPGGSALVSLRGVEKTFANGTTALAGLDLDVGGGEFLALLGPSGCGKSTALRIIAGLIGPSAGMVVWPGSVSEDHRGEIGFVFQEPTLMPWATAPTMSGCRCACAVFPAAPPRSGSPKGWPWSAWKISPAPIRANCRAA
jgi:hypothetical protein